MDENLAVQPTERESICAGCIVAVRYHDFFCLILMEVCVRRSGRRKLVQCNIEYYNKT